ncbi:hypothetical protein SAMN05421823_106243 [Catalinimonas alkaloidigena]|uniref:DUF1440 domain-containing protein n=1 Tax=Catalinimonas alkaloidigena TaxID=1075417 RepID=A0A1G9KS85_9BACT|nr:hypothetical protein [Catalinimonas alkaloidigena]SDL52598.1 hypothetical protein SAMN05421823_106243 [Catalinimonas alkaloidigena]
MTTLQHSLGKLGSILGRGILAGLAGTAAITVSQMIEMKLTHRSASEAPVRIGSEVLGVEPTGKPHPLHEKQYGNKATKDAHTARFAQIMHWSYGTSLGISRGFVAATGLKGWPATAVHFAIVWGTALVMLPSTKQAKPITEWPPEQIAIDFWHHAVYALAAGAAYDAIDVD